MKKGNVLFFVGAVIGLLIGYYAGVTKVQSKTTAAPKPATEATQAHGRNIFFENETLTAEIKLKQPLARAETYRQIHDLTSLYFHCLAPVLRPEPEQARIFFHNLTYGLQTAAEFNKNLLAQTEVK